MPWPLISLRDRRQQVRDDFATHCSGADATVPNSVTRVIAEDQANLTFDNDQHLDWLARMMMPDTAEGEFADRWGNIWLPAGRKGATYATGQVTVTGTAGSIVDTGATLTAPAVDANGNPLTLQFSVTTGGTLSSTSLVLPIAALTAGAMPNLLTGAQLSFVNTPNGVDGSAAVAAPGLAGGADEEADPDLIDRYIDRIQNPPHGGNANDYVAWALEVAGVTRAWASQEIGIGTVTVRFMMDVVRASTSGIPASGDVALVQAHIDPLRPVSMASLFVVAPIPQVLNLTITGLARDTPETRAAINVEYAAMLNARASPGGIIYASWIREAISIATGEEHHDIVIANVTPATAGHIVVPGAITFA